MDKDLRTTPLAELWIQYARLSEGGFGRVMLESDFMEMMKRLQSETVSISKAEAAQILKRWTGDAPVTTNDAPIIAKLERIAASNPAPQAVPERVAEHGHSLEEGGSPASNGGLAVAGFAESAAASVVTEEGFTHQIHFMQRQSQMLAEQGDDVAARVMADAAKMAADVWKDRERYRQGMANWKRTAEAKDAVSSGSPSATAAPVPQLGIKDPRPCVHPIGLTTCGYPQEDRMHEGSNEPAPPAGRHVYTPPADDEPADRNIPKRAP